MRTDLCIEHLLRNHSELPYWINQLPNDKPWMLSEGTIVKWNVAQLGPQPTMEELAAIEPAALQAAKEAVAATITQDERDAATIAALVAKVAVLEKMAGITETTVADVVAARDAKLAAVVAEKVQAVSVAVEPGLDKGVNP